MRRTLKLTVTVMALALSGAWAQEVTVPMHVDGNSGVISASLQASPQPVNGGGTMVRSMAALMDVAQTVVKIDYFPGPAMNSPNITAFLTNLLNGTAAKVPALLPQDIIATTSDLSRGYTYYRVEITNPQGIALRDYILEQDSNDQFNGVPQHSLKLTQDMINFDYDQWRPGTKADGFIITAGSNTQVANKLIIIGVCISFTGITPAAYQNTSQYIGMQVPAFAITTLVKARGTTGTTTLISQSWSTTAVVTPPPQHVSLKIEKVVLVTVTGISPGTAYTVQFASSVTGPWSDYKTVYGAPDGTATFTAPIDILLREVLWR